MHVESFLPANLCLVTLVNSEQCSHFQSFRLQQMVNNKALFTIYNMQNTYYVKQECVKTSIFEIKCIGNNAGASRVNRNILLYLTLPSTLPLRAKTGRYVLTLLIAYRALVSLFFHAFMCSSLSFIRRPKTTV